MKVAFVQKTHKPLDDRVYYHQKPALEKAGCEVVILSAATDNCNLDNAFCFDSTDMRTGCHKQNVRHFKNIVSRCDDL